MAKAKGKKGKAKAVVAEPIATADDSEEAVKLRRVLRIMNAEIQQEKALANDFQQQQEKIRIFWNLDKQRLAELKLIKREKERNKEELLEKHAFELKAYKMKLCHVLHEQQKQVTDLRTDFEVGLSTQQTANRTIEQEIQDATWEDKRISREAEISHCNLVQKLKQEQEKKIMMLRREYERKAEQMREAYEDRQAKIRAEATLNSKEDTHRIEHRKSQHINHLMSIHKEEFQKIKNYYHDITHNNLDLIKSLKEEVLEKKKKEHKDEKAVTEIAQINRKLAEPLKKHLREVEELRVELRNYDRDKVHLEATKKRTACLEQRISHLKWQHEVLYQKYERVVASRDMLKRELEEKSFDVQQKNGFRKLILEKKIEAIQNDIEKKETALHEVLASTNLQPEVLGDVSRRLEDVLLAKNETVRDLEEKLAEIKHMYNNSIQVYNARLAEHQISQAELGFEPKPI